MQSSYQITPEHLPQQFRGAPQNCRGSLRSCFPLSTTHPLTLEEGFRHVAVVDMGFDHLAAEKDVAVVRQTVFKVLRQRRGWLRWRARWQ